MGLPSLASAWSKLDSSVQCRSMMSFVAAIVFPADSGGQHVNKLDIYGLICHDANHCGWWTSKKPSQAQLVICCVRGKCCVRNKISLPWAAISNAAMVSRTLTSYNYTSACNSSLRSSRNTLACLSRHNNAAQLHQYGTVAASGHRLERKYRSAVKQMSYHIASSIAQVVVSTEQEGNTQCVRPWRWKDWIWFQNKSVTFVKIACEHDR